MAGHLRFHLLRHDVPLFDWPGSDDALGAADSVDLTGERLGLAAAPRLEVADLGRLALAELPERRRGHGVGVDEPAHARPVIDQDDRRLAGEVDRPHRIALVDDVRRRGAVLRRLAGRLLGAGPLRPAEAGAGTVARRGEPRARAEEALLT